jgi:tight adherence protein B
VIGRVRPWSSIGQKLRTRLERSDSDVGDLLPLVAGELAAHVRAGRSLAQAIAGCGDDLPEPARASLRSAGAAVGLGASPADALRALGDGEDAALLRGLVALQAKSGGDLGEMLDGLATALMERRAQRRAAQVATAQARATARIVSWMPVAGMAMLWLVDRPAVLALVHSPLGWAAVVVSAGLTAAGQTIVRRLAAVWA